MQFTPTEQSLLTHVYSNPIPTRIPLEESPPWFHIADANALVELGYIQTRKETIDGKRYLEIWRNQSLKAEREVSLFQEPPEPSLPLIDDDYEILKHLDSRHARTAASLQKHNRYKDGTLTGEILRLNRKRISDRLNHMKELGLVEHGGKHAGWTITTKGQEVLRQKELEEKARQNIQRP